MINVLIQNKDTENSLNVRLYPEPEEGGEPIPVITLGPNEKQTLTLYDGMISWPKSFVKFRRSTGMRSK